MSDGYVVCFYDDAVDDLTELDENEVKRFVWYIYGIYIFSVVLEINNGWFNAKSASIEKFSMFTRIWGYFECGYFIPPLRQRESLLIDNIYLYWNIFSINEPLSFSAILGDTILNNI